MQQYTIFDNKSKNSTIIVIVRHLQGCIGDARRQEGNVVLGCKFNAFRVHTTGVTLIKDVGVVCRLCKLATFALIDCQFRKSSACNLHFEARS